MPHMLQRRHVHCTALQTVPRHRRLERLAQGHGGPAYALLAGRLQRASAPPWSPQRYRWRWRWRCTPPAPRSHVGRDASGDSSLAVRVDAPRASSRRTRLEEPLGVVHCGAIVLRQSARQRARSCRACSACPTARRAGASAAPAPRPTSVTVDPMLCRHTTLTAVTTTA